jgi:hypothetical protein
LSRFQNGRCLAGRSLKVPPEKSVLKLKVGDVVKLSEADFVRLSKAFFAALEEKYLSRPFAEPMFDAWQSQYRDRPSRKRRFTKDTSSLAFDRTCKTAKGRVFKIAR